MQEMFFLQGCMSHKFLRRYVQPLAWTILTIGGLIYLFDVPPDEMVFECALFYLLYFLIGNKPRR